MRPLIFAFLFALALASDTSEAQAAPRCVNGVCAAPSGGGVGSGGIVHRVFHGGGPVRNVVAAVAERRPLRSLIENRPRLLGRVFGRCRGCE